jgi:drug/metabolite transporter (DMT)-like permease
VAAVAVAAVASGIVALGGRWTVAPITVQAVGAVAFLGVVCSGLAHWLWYAAVRDVGSTRAGAYLYLEPFVTWLAAATLLGERIALLGVAGGVAVLLAVWLVSSARRSRP